MHIRDQFKVTPMLWHSSMLMEWLQTFSKSLRESDTVLETKNNCLSFIDYFHSPLLHSNECL